LLNRMQPATMVAAAEKRSDIALGEMVIPAMGEEMVVAEIDSTETATTIIPSTLRPLK
jgi:hypothetical protein